MENYNQPPQYNFQYQQVPTPLPPPSEHTHLHHNRQQEKPIFLFENDEFFTESEWYGKVIAAASATYKHCYRLFFAGFIMICFLCVPFIGMGAGMLDAFITLFARPFARPVGKVMADVMGYTYYRSRDTVFPRTGEKNV